MSTVSVPTQALAGQINCGGSTFPLVIPCPAGITSLTASLDWITQHLPALQAHLTESGVLLFRGFPLTSAEDFDAFSAAFGYRTFTYKESLSNAVRINFTERVFTANEAPKDVEIFLHHEMAQTPISPDKLFFFCLQAADAGGATPVCRSDMLYRRLKIIAPELAAACESKGLKYTTRMPGENDEKSGQGRSWKSTLNCQNKDEAERKLAELGYSWQWQDDGSLRATTPVLPAVLTLSNGKQVFYNQLIAAYMGWKGVRENPASAITYGDGSHLSPADLELINNLSADFTFDVPWQNGDVALVDNHMAMHGRRPYSGDTKRQVLVALGKS
ncbi:SyrP protein [Pokkaliibacter plantistimulans]|uniref:SyrP protein n=1 Tax=Pokkaliibacter plantistimulans TaxID=1635171 RepID=A0ABX5LXQ7_9GAMM|nr:TauD/TfdA family dioxygenase [Pokkaliibacter plantistimulans]PXF30081.1 SyrP protein [Pokkaliibacter plantistimulans]